MIHERARINVKFYQSKVLELTKYKLITEDSAAEKNLFTNT